VIEGYMPGSNGPIGFLGLAILLRFPEYGTRVDYQWII
jgi:hypothetical protein